MIRNVSKKSNISLSRQPSRNLEIVKYDNKGSKMDIFNILSSKPHNLHHLKRYVKFIENCKNQNLVGYTEKHHICPKAKDLFPEYRKSKWNIIVLSGRQHFIAHMMLQKIYSGGQNYAFWSMCTKQSRNNNRDYQISSRIYEYAKLEQSKEHSKRLKGKSNPGVAKKAKGMVTCKDVDGNFFKVTREEFKTRSDLFGVNKGKIRTIEERRKNSESTKGKNLNKKPIIKDGKRKFVSPLDYNILVSEGWKDYKGSYDRKGKEKECQYCKLQASPSNYKRWHGENCRFRFQLDKS